jgi:hypothetical protein
MPSFVSSAVWLHTRIMAKPSGVPVRAPPSATKRGRFADTVERRLRNLAELWDDDGRGYELIRAFVVATCAFALVPASGALAQEGEAPVPSVEGPVEAGIQAHPWNHSLEPLKGPGFDYVEEEYFFSGTATSLADGATAPFKTRMLVRLPRDAKDFNGQVAVEWLNVTASHDLETGWPIPGGKFLMKRGIGYVGVSAQLVGVCCNQGSLKVWDPERYESLVHPGDTFSYDIFSQATQALRAPKQNGGPGADPMRGMTVEKLIATGASQSAGYLTTFVNDGYNRGTVDLFWITRGGGPYEDFSTPIVMLNEEDNEIPQPDNPKLVGWEEAGTAHAPKAFLDYSFGISDRDLAGRPSALGAVAQQCSVNRGRVDYSARALVHHIDRYFETGRMPPAAPRMERDQSGGLVRDENGLAQGGLRHTFVHVPVALNKGEECILFGLYEPWEHEKIRGLYPTRCNYVTKVRDWADHEVRKGWLLPEDRDSSVADAVALKDPWPGDSLGLQPGKARGRALGEAKLGRRRAKQRQALGVVFGRSGGQTDFFCAPDGEAVRVGHVRDRSAIALTASEKFSVAGIRAGDRLRALKRKLRGERRVRSGGATWYVGPRSPVRRVFRTSGKRVVEVGIVGGRFVAGPRAAKFLRRWTR